MIFYRTLALDSEGELHRCIHQHLTLGSAVACRDRVGVGAFIQGVEDELERGLNNQEFAEVLIYRVAARARREEQQHGRAV